MNTTLGTEIATWCRTAFVWGNDGYIAVSSINITMDLQESKRLFGVTGSTPAEAQSWWENNTSPECFLRGPAENALHLWFVEQGGSAVTMGK